MFLIKQTHPSAQTARSSSLWLGSPSHLLFLTDRASQEDTEAVSASRAHERALLCHLSPFLENSPSDGQETSCEPSVALEKVSFPLIISDRGWGK